MTRLIVDVLVAASALPFIVYLVGDVLRLFGWDLTITVSRREDPRVEVDR